MRPPRPPRIEKLHADHVTIGFDCGREELNRFLHRFAPVGQRADSSQTYLALAGGRVVGYYALTVGEVAYADATERPRKGLARLAVARTEQGRGFGAGLLEDAMRRALRAADIAGIRGALLGTDKIVRQGPSSFRSLGRRSCRSGRCFSPPPGFQT